MKIPLQELANYLAYDLRVERRVYKHERFKVFSAYDLIPYDNELDNLIPIVRPLSDLTKEITHNGKKFVPMIKLLEFLKEPTVDIDFHSNQYEAVIYFGRSKTSWLSYDFAFKTFSFFIGDSSESYPFELYQKLFEWHFDVFGWISRGLATDYNSILEEYKS